MVFSTLFRCIGQFQNILLISINKTNVLRDTGLITLILGVFLTLLFLGPKNSNLPFLALGAEGLVIKYLIIEITYCCLVFIQLKNL